MMKLSKINEVLAMKKERDLLFLKTREFTSVGIEYLDVHSGASILTLNRSHPSEGNRIAFEHVRAALYDLFNDGIIQIDRDLAALGVDVSDE